MSVKELVLKDELNNSIKFRKVVSGFILSVLDMNKTTNAFLTRDQAHLLMLYLQEHLK